MDLKADNWGIATYNLKQRAKLRHVDACLLPESQYQKTTGLERIELINQSAAGLDLGAIDLSTSFLGHRLCAPLMIAPMTGGFVLGALLNQRWALAAEHFGIPMGVGSQRLALINKDVSQSFKVRAYAKTALLFANLGAAQLLEKNSLDLAMRAVDMIEANALFIHLNPLQEACQKGGDTMWSGVLKGIESVVAKLAQNNIPVFVREVCFGISADAAKTLINSGVSGIDCAGAGGTSWAKVESLCAEEEQYKRLGQVFGEWGIPTAQSITNVRNVNPDIPLVATGGIRTGLDIAKCLALGADVAGMAQPMLAAAIKGEQELFNFIEQILLELRVTLFSAGIARVSDLKNSLKIS